MKDKKNTPGICDLHRRDLRRHSNNPYRSVFLIAALAILSTSAFFVPLQTRHPTDMNATTTGTSLGVSTVSTTSFTRAGGQTVEIGFPGQEGDYNETGTPVLYRGIYEEVRIHVSGTNASLRLEFQGTPAEGDREDFYTYLFVYNSTGWHDVYYNHYLNETMCHANDTNIVFGVGVSQYAYLTESETNTSRPSGPWSMVVAVDGEEVYNGTICVSPPVWSPGLFGGDFYFRVDPYASGSFEPMETFNYSRLKNNGNIPLSYKVDPGAYSTIISLENASGTLGPGEDVLIKMTVESPSWSPRTMDFDIPIYAEVPGQIYDPFSQVSLGYRFATTLNVHIEVRMEGYSIKDFGPVVIQYKNGPNNRGGSFVLDYMEEITLIYYVTGTEDVTVDLSAVNITIADVKLDGESLGDEKSLLLNLREDRPLVLNITVRGDHPSTQGVLILSFLNDTGEMGHIKNYFQTNPAPPGAEEETPKNPAVLAALAAGLAVFALIIYVYKEERKKREKREKQKNVKEKKSEKDMEKKKNRSEGGGERKQRGK